MTIYGLSQGSAVRFRAVEMDWTGRFQPGSGTAVLPWQNRRQTGLIRVPDSGRAGMKATMPEGRRVPGKASPCGRCELTWQGLLRPHIDSHKTLPVPLLGKQPEGQIGSRQAGQSLGTAPPLFGSGAPGVLLRVWGTSSKGWTRN